MTKPSKSSAFGDFSRFPNAGLYFALRSKTSGFVQEPTESRLTPTTERQLQCVWYDESLRPKNLSTSEGDAIRIIHPGRWNFEAGPDFLDAEIEILPGRQRIVGDVEIHIDPADWFQHGHDQDPRYKHVRIHVVAHKGRHKPNDLIQIELRPFLAENPTFSFEAIDVSAYPYQVNSADPPCRKLLQSWDIQDLATLLEAAGEERIRQKAVRIKNSINALGSEQALYRETLGALGYKHNKGACIYLADHLPLSLLRERAAGNLEAGFALLLGVSGFLPGNPEQISTEGRDYARQLWSHWWRHRADLDDLALTPENWVLSTVRPANAPQRRLMAAALLFLSTNYTDWALCADPKQERVPGIRNRLYIHHPFWDVYSCLTNSKPMPRKTALLGNSRIDALLINILIAFWLAQNSGLSLSDVAHLIPKTASNAPTTYTAHALFGPDVPRALIASGLRQQGLLQIFHDFCLSSSCSECAFAGAVSAHSTTE